MKGRVSKENTNIRRTEQYLLCKIHPTSVHIYLSPNIKGFTGGRIEQYLIGQEFRYADVALLQVFTQKIQSPLCNPSETSTLAPFDKCLKVIKLPVLLHKSILNSHFIINGDNTEQRIRICNAALLPRLPYYCSCRAWCWRIRRQMQRRCRNRNQSQSHSPQTCSTDPDQFQPHKVKPEFLVQAPRQRSRVSRGTAILVTSRNFQRPR